MKESPFVRHREDWPPSKQQRLRLDTLEPIAYSSLLKRLVACCTALTVLVVIMITGLVVAMVVAMLVVLELIESGHGSGDDVERRCFAGWYRR